jgi:hypothetical protein
MTDWADKLATELLPFPAFATIHVATIGGIPEMQEAAKIAMRREILTNDDKKAAIATALRAAHRRGKVEGMREAADLAAGLFEQGFSWNLEHWDKTSEYGKGRIDATDIICAAADELEKQP